MKYLKKFSTNNEYEAYIASEDKALPNVSLCEDTKDVYYNPSTIPPTPPTPTETRVVAKYNVTNTSSPTKICCDGVAISIFSSMEIDGVQQPSVVSAYTFSTTGEHTVKYILADPTSIGKFAFEGCVTLTDITIPDSVTSIGDQAFNMCYELIRLNSDTDYVLNIPSNVTSIGNYAFQYCNTFNSVTIPNSVTSIGIGAFSGCHCIESITIPDSVTRIGENAFNYCTGLTSCTIGSGVTSIGENAFQDCSGLTNIYIDAIDPPQLDNYNLGIELCEETEGGGSSGSGSGSGGDCGDCPVTIHVPPQSESYYKGAWYKYRCMIVTW